jgi:hypothetical protein
VTVQVIVQIGLAIGLLAAAGILSSAVRTRRRRQRIATLAQLHGLRRADAKQQFALTPHASILAGRSREFKIDDVLVGEDDDGRFFLARRTIDLYQDHTLLFEAPDETRVSDFRFYPHRESRWNWRDLIPGRRAPRDEWKHRLEWTAKRSRWSDAGSLGFGARVVGHAARMCDQPDAILMGVEIHDSRVLIYSPGALGAEELERFFSDSTLLRRAILNAMRHAHSRAAESRAVSPRYSESEDVTIQVLRT